jgi:hypothetical protein
MAAYSCIPMEASVRATMLALVAAVGTLALSVPAQATPVVPYDPALTTPLMTLVRQGCGRGWHLEWRRDRWGRAFRRCVRNRYRYY